MACVVCIPAHSNHVARNYLLRLLKNYPDEPLSGHCIRGRAVLQNSSAPAVSIRRPTGTCAASCACRRRGRAGAAPRGIPASLDCGGGQYPHFHEAQKDRSWFCTHPHPTARHDRPTQIRAVDPRLGSCPPLTRTAAACNTSISSLLTIPAHARRPRASAIAVVTPPRAATALNPYLAAARLLGVRYRMLLRA